MSEVTQETYAAFERRLEVATEAMNDAVEGFRQALVGAVCEFTAAYAPDAARVELVPDTDWDWSLNRLVDAAGNEVELSAPAHEAFDDLFGSWSMSRLPFWREADRGFINVAERTFTVYDRVLVQA